MLTARRRGPRRRSRSRSRSRDRSALCLARRYRARDRGRIPVSGRGRRALRLGSRRHRPPRARLATTAHARAGGDRVRARRLLLHDGHGDDTRASGGARHRDPVRPWARLSRCRVRGERRSAAHGLVPLLDERCRRDPAPRRPLDRNRPCSTTQLCSQVAAMACCCSTPAGTARAAAERWSSDAMGIKTWPVRSRSSHRSPTSRRRSA